MAEKDAPIEQLMVDEYNIREIIDRIYVKKSTMINPDIVLSLRHLVAVNDTKDHIRQLRIFQLRKQILEEASEIYISNGEEKLFDESVDELEVIMKILEDHTITR